MPSDDERNAVLFETTPLLGLQAVEFRLGLYKLAEQRARELLKEPWLEIVPEQGPHASLLLAQTLIHRARDASAGLEDGDVDGLLYEAEQAFLSTLNAEPPATFEERQLARIGLTDLYWQRGDRDAEMSAIEASYAEPEGETQTMWRADRAAYRARRALADLKTARSEVEGCLEEIEAVFDELEQDWLNVERPPEGIGFLHWDEQRLVLGTWIKLLVAVHGKERGAEHALEALARAQSIGTLTRRVAESASVREVESGQAWRRFRESLPPESGVLIFLPSMDSSHVVAIDAEKATHVELGASRRELQKAARPVISFTTQPPGRMSEADGRQAAMVFAELLLPEEIRAQLGSWKRVVFIGAELLGDPALEGLPLGGRSLGEQLATSYLPSLELGQLLSDRLRNTGFDPGEVVVLSAADMPGGPELEPAERDRLARWSTPAGGTTPTLRSGGWHDLGHGLLVALAHGDYRASERRPAHLLMPDGPVGAEQLEAASMPPLVCLLSCGAARGTIQKGDDGVAHLGGAAIVGGASAVILARNKIETAASLALFDRFLSELRAGAEPDEALRRARQELIRARPEWAHPFYSASLWIFLKPLPPPAT